MHEIEFETTDSNRLTFQQQPRRCIDQRASVLVFLVILSLIMGIVTYLLMTAWDMPDYKAFIASAMVLGSNLILLLSFAYLHRCTNRANGYYQRTKKEEETDDDV